MVTFHFKKERAVWEGIVISFFPVLIAAHFFPPVTKTSLNIVTYFLFLISFYFYLCCNVKLQLLELHPADD